jgi:hypothetical protein
MFTSNAKGSGKDRFGWMLNKELISPKQTSLKKVQFPVEEIKETIIFEENPFEANDDENDEDKDQVNGDEDEMGNLDSQNTAGNKKRKGRSAHKRAKKRATLSSGKCLPDE